MLPSFDGFQIVKRFHLLFFLFLLTHVLFEILVLLGLKTLLVFQIISYAFFLLSDTLPESTIRIFLNFTISSIEVINCLLSLIFNFLELQLKVMHSIIGFLFHSPFLHLDLFLHLLKFLHHILLVLHNGLWLARVNRFANKTVIWLLSSYVESTFVAAISILIGAKLTILNKTNFTSSLWIGLRVSKWRKQLFDLMWTESLVWLEFRLQSIKMSLRRFGSMRHARMMLSHQLGEIECFLVTCETTAQIKAFANIATL